MQLKFDQLAGHLHKHLAPVYVVGGEEPLHQQEAADMVRKKAKEQGFYERVIFDVDAHFAWPQLSETLRERSLFSPKQFVELRMPLAKPGTEGAKLLENIGKQPYPDTLLLLLTGKLDSATLKTRWLSTLESAGVLLQIWPLDNQRLPRWIEARLQARGMKVAAETLQYLANHVEGNLLAAQQEIDKLYLLYGESAISHAQVEESLINSTRFSGFDLTQAFLAGDSERIIRIIKELHEEEAELIMVLGAVSYVLRELVLLTHPKQESHASPTKHWDRQRAALTQAASRHSHRVWCLLLAECARIDRLAKGITAMDDPWIVLTRLCLKAAGGQPLSGKTVH